MYTREQRQRAIDAFIRLGHSYAATVRELGYPSEACLHNWWRDYEARGCVAECKYRREPKFDEGMRRRAVEHYLEHGRNASRTMRELGYPGNRRYLAAWIDELAPGERRVSTRGPGRGRLTMAEKIGAVAALESGEGTAAELAASLGVTRAALYDWRRQIVGHNGGAPEERGRPVSEPYDDLPDDIEELRAMEGDLKRQVRELQLEIDVLRATREVAKKDAGTDPKRLANEEKARVIDALRPRWRLKELLGALDIAKSSYYYAKAALERTEAEWRARARTAVVASFEASGATYGYRRVLADVNAGRPMGMRIGEWTVRSIMREEGLVARTPRRKRRYGSYVGEVSEAPENLLRDEEGRHHFGAERPNEVWVTDITEFRIPAGKVYLSPIIDCFDGCPVAWSQSTTPDAELANSSLRAACGQLGEGDHPILHSDRGGHYRWTDWISICREKGLVRSMSRKGCSPDNARAEGFFGRLKVEFFHGRDWQGVSLGEFEAMLDSYIVWYRDERLKSDLGYRSPMQYRRDLELIA